MKSDHFNVEDSYIVKSPQGGFTSFVGPDATLYYQARLVYAGLMACSKGWRLSRNATPTQMMQMASKFTGKQYKRGDYKTAMADVAHWISTMELALPVVEKDK